MNIVRKVTVAQAAGNELEFVLSDESKGRDGLVIETRGWQTDNFRRNPIALFGHDHRFPIGKWENVRAVGDKLVGHLRLAALGTSDRIDEIIRLVEQGIVRAVSVGFNMIEREPLTDNSGYRVKRQELLEVSLVSVPALPSALQMARSLNISDDTLRIVFGEHAGKDDAVMRRRSIGEHAANPPARKTGTMTLSLSKRIEDAQNEIVRLRDLLTAETNKEGDLDQVVIDETTAQIEAKEATLVGWKRAETALASKTIESKAVNGGSSSNGYQRPFATPAKKLKPGEHIMRSLVGMTVACARREYSADGIHKAIAERYGEDGKFDNDTSIVLRALSRPEGVGVQDMVTRAATAPADTTTSGWASQLVQTEVRGFTEILMPASVYPGLSSRGMSLSFGRSGIISIPTRSATPTIAGSFVAQGAPIPVRQGAFTSITLTPKKMAVISVFTRQIAEHSTPSIEGLIRKQIEEDTSGALDSVLLDATAATTTRPAGLRAGVSVTSATAGGGFNALVGDITNLLGALVTGSNGNLRSPVWIMNPINAIAISMTQNAGGDFPFEQEINQNRLRGYPLIQSATVTADMVIVVDAADFVSIEGDTPRFDASDQAVVHMEDTTPLAIGTVGTPATVAAPTRSLWQTDSVGLRMMMDVNWGLLRTGTVAWTETVTW